MEIAQTADYALRVLLALEERDGQTMSELTAHVGLNRSVVHRTVVTLRRRSAISRDVSGRYRLGPLLVALGRDLPHELAHVGHDELRDLAQRIEETVILSVREGDESVVVAQERGHRGPLRVEYEVDFRQPLARGASSLAILAHVEAGDEVMKGMPERAEALAEIRRQGFARTVGEIRPHMLGLAVPILTRHGVGGSLGVVAPTTRAARLDEVLPDLRDTATRISAVYDAYLEGRSGATP